MWIYFWIILLPHHSLITVAFNLEIKKWKSTNFVLTVSLTIFQVTYISTQTLKSTCQFLEIDGNIRIMSGLSMEQSGRTDILVILSFPIHEQITSLHLFSHFFLLAMSDRFYCTDCAYTLLNLEVFHVFYVKWNKSLFIYSWIFNFMFKLFIAGIQKYYWFFCILTLHPMTLLNSLFLTAFYRFLRTFFITVI